jgi:phosphohistidine phosphatase
MPRLYLLRHAKSDWADPTIPDHERPLNKRGRRAAADVGAELLRLGADVQLVLCSTARRTRQTVSLLAVPFATVEYEDLLYLADVEQLFARLRDLSADVERVLLVGHNPGMHELAGALCGPDDRLADFPTAALAVVDVSGPWPALGPGAGRLQSLFVPSRR